jgi:hypothetical protein
LAGRGAGETQTPERLSEIGAAAPDRDPQRAGIGLGGGAKNPVGSRRVLPFPDAVFIGDLGAGNRLPRLDDGAEGIGRGVSPVVEGQVGMDLRVGVDGLMDQLGPDSLPVSHVRRGDEALNLELVREEEKADERLSVVGLAHAGREAADVGKDEEARAAAGGENERCEKQEGEAAHVLLSQVPKDPEGEGGRRRGPAGPLDGPPQAGLGEDPASEGVGLGLDRVEQVGDGLALDRGPLTVTSRDACGEPTGSLRPQRMEAARYWAGVAPMETFGLGGKGRRPLQGVEGGQARRAQVSQLPRPWRDENPAVMLRLRAIC